MFARLGLAAPHLFAALLAAIVLALSGVGPSRPVRPAVMVAQGMLAVTIGLSVRRETLTALGIHWPAVVGIALATLVLSVLAGIALGRHRDVDQVTGVLSMIAGGATGLVAVAGDLGGDERTVVVVQYLRVAFVVLTMPLAVTYLFAAHTATVGQASSQTSQAPWWVGVAFMVGAIVVGTGVAVVVRLPIPATLGPLLLSAAIELSGWADRVAIPSAVMPAAFLIIGWQAGLSFTKGSVAALGRIFVWALALMVALTAACAGLGWLLSTWTGVSALQGYLATTPGGLAAVLAVSSATGSDVTFVAGSQVIRLVLMLVSAPALAWAMRWWVKRSARNAAPIGESAA